jgi:ABC-2 type transport system ATP-binding protein
VIEVQGLTKRYGSLTAVDNLSFRVNKGEIIGFLGPNGAGKTTTMRILTGFLPPTDGTARVGDHDVFEDSMAVRRMIGYLPETPPVYPELTVRRYLRFVAEIKDIPRKELKEHVDTAIERTALKSVANRLIRNLSKGYRQRVGLAQALVHNPPVLILDEPTSGLDPGQIIETRELITSLAGEHTIILSTHILPEVAATCERVIILHEGRIAAEDSIEDLGRRTDHGSIRVTVRGDADQVAAAFKKIDGVVGVRPRNGVGDASVFSVESADTDIREQLFRTVADHDWVLLEMRPEAASLEEIFISVTSHA